MRLGELDWKASCAANYLFIFFLAETCLNGNRPPKYQANFKVYV